MKNEDEKFDNLLRNRMDSMPDEFEEVYWVKAKKLIRAERQLKTNLFLYGLVLFVITGVISGLGFYMNSYLPGIVTNIEEQGIEKEILAHNELKNTNDNSVANPQTHKTNINMATYSKPEIHNQLKPAQDNAKKTNTEPATVVFIKAQDKKTKADLNIMNSSVYTIADLIQPIDEPNLEINTNEVKPESDIIETAGIDAIYIEAKGIKQLKLNRLICDTCNPVRTNFHKQFDQGANPSFLALEGTLTGFNGNDFSSKNFNFGYGIRYYYFFKPRLGVIAGIEYRRLNENMNARNYQYSNYDFGSTYETKSIQTQRLDYLQIPLSFIYRFNGKHMLNAGVNYLLLLQTTERITTTKTGDQTLSSVKVENGYFDAVNRNDLQLNLGYSFFINSKIVLHSNMYLGLLDVSNNTLFKENKFDRNKGFTLGLSYKIK
ncbi:MAG: hypothetical protein Q8M15_11350 [Bacteroidota bacterium]|nr:hypothetical protein [Bacteroidota bacterium]